MVDKLLRFEIAFLNQLILLNKIDAEKLELRDRYQKVCSPFSKLQITATEICRISIIY